MLKIEFCDGAKGALKTEPSILPGAAPTVRLLPLQNRHILGIDADSFESVRGPKPRRSKAADRKALPSALAALLIPGARQLIAHAVVGRSNVKNIGAAQVRVLRRPGRVA